MTSLEKRQRRAEQQEMMRYQAAMQEIERMAQIVMDDTEPADLRLECARAVIRIAMAKPFN